MVAGFSLVARIQRVYEEAVRYRLGRINGSQPNKSAARFSILHGTMAIASRACSSETGGASAMISFPFLILFTGPLFVALFGR